MKLVALMQLLASVGMDDYHSLSVWDWRKGKVVASTRGHGDKVNKIINSLGQLVLCVGLTVNVPLSDI